MARYTNNPLIAAAKGILSGLWERVNSSNGDRSMDAHLPTHIREAIRRSENATTRSYRYVLPTQLLAKVADSELDCRAIQQGSGLQHSFDARSLCHAVVVPFDRENHCALGGSPEPYVNNPLRIPSISPDHRGAQRNKEEFDDLCAVLEYAEQYPSRAENLLLWTLFCVRERLENVHITYPVPNRVSLAQCEQILERFLSERTGGVRLQVVTVALFQSIGERFGLFTRVESATINASDAATGNLADLVCRSDDGCPVIAVEVKDRQLTLRHIQDKLPSMRMQRITELLFLVQGGILTDEATDIANLTAQQFATGQNLYIVEFDGFLRACLTLLGEEARTEFLRKIGRELDESHADLAHRQAWHMFLTQL